MTEPVPRTDPAYDVLRGGRTSLKAFFSPRNVALIGATERQGSVGRTMLWNLISSPFGGSTFPVNPKRDQVLGIRAYPNLAALPEAIDLAVIATPAPTVPGLIRDCVAHNIPAAIVISAGFRESGAAGIELERQILEQTRTGKIRVIGPNCLGVMRPQSGLNATFAATIARPGSVAFISQSGALCTAVLDWSLQAQVGFSAFVSIGSMLDVNWGDLIYDLGEDPCTQSIVIYMETIGNARSFLSAAREVALSKPIIVIKAGRTEVAAKAAASHTGSLVGSDEVLDAAFRRCGVLRVNRISELFHMAETLGMQPRPTGPRLTIVTNAGGPAVLATDSLIGSGGQLATLAPETLTSLNDILPDHWSHANPIDILGDADADRYAQSLAIAAKDPNSDGLMVILTPQAMTDALRTAEQLRPLGKSLGKPVLASWMGGASVAAGISTLAKGSIPTFPYPDTAARVFEYMWQYSANLRALFEAPSVTSQIECEVDERGRATALVDAARASGRQLLTEWESKQILAAYRIPTVEMRLAKTAEEAVQQARELGFPVVLKLHSETITHKTDLGGVQLNLRDEAAVQQAYRAIRTSVSERAGAEHFLGVAVQPMVSHNGYELILGSSIDPQFGPVLLFGSGGQLVEVYKDRELGLPPLNTTLALRMMERTRIFKALQGIRGRKPIDLEALKQLLVRFSNLVVEQRWIKEIDINPLIASSDQLIAVDARVVLHSSDVREDQLPQPAIRPYPVQYIVPWTMKDGTQVIIRPIRPEDEPLMVKFHATLSERSVYFRYFNMLQLSQRVAHERLSRLCFIDFDLAMALVVDRHDPQTGEHEIIAVGRLSKLSGAKAEFAIIVSDEYQAQGLGSELLSRLVQVGRDERLRQISADILPENVGMQRVSQKLGFAIHPRDEGTLMRAELNLA
ncbi:MAG: bifunctional acetate--CoA ligase family protein/GNAT family N-acetyltransferase [Planctomycetes bacterium]|nr:bifunctional acetate--CoA ligase family protein/GNAT family N-acetyltransferase [Planctomycetota bacterium]